MSRCGLEFRTETIDRIHAILAETHDSMAETMIKADICIDPNGDIRPCCSMEPVGHILVDELEALENSSKCIQVAARGLEKSCPGCSCHYNLSLDMNLRVRVQSLYRRLCARVGEPPIAHN